ncbi:DUF5689 domain-containing protein [Bacteroidales bacterium OttesenSCG-928-I21]|nr:DUF5689 domain-containing protein [Bacteroidales bacterium OttesenSCG-928-I21]
MKIKIILSVIISVMVLSFVRCDKELDSPPLKQIDKNKILTIADIYKIHADSGNNYIFRDEYMLYGTIIMDDNLGNIYRESYIQDSTGGLNLYRLGTTGATEQDTYVRINLNNVKITEYSGKMELVFDEVENPKRQIVVLQTNNIVEPVEITISDLNTGNYDCVLVKVKDVEFADTTQTYASFGGSSYQNRTLRNCEGQSIIIRSSDQSDFADYPLPKGKGDITGVITKFVNYQGAITWQLLVRNPNETKMNTERCQSTK